MEGMIPVKVLYVEDESAILGAVRTFLELFCSEVVVAENGARALELFRQHRPDLVITDICMPIMDGLELIERLRVEDPELPVLITTAFSEVPHLLRAIELGVAGFIRKPLDYDKLQQSIRNAALPVLQQREIDLLRKGRARALYPGNSPRTAKVAEQISLICDTDYSVLIHGEKGTGKARVAAAIHAASRRHRGPLIPVHCSSVSPEQFELELFGREKRVIGCCSLAGSGTLLLQNVDAAPLQVQAKLLMAMTEKVITPVGAKTFIPCDIRVMVTVVGDPRQLVASGRLLEGLYYHLNDFAIAVPPLRDIQEDLAVMAKGFLVEGADDAGRAVPRLTDEAVALLRKCNWPGNIRELKNLMRRAVLYADREVTPATLSPLLREGSAVPLASFDKMPESLALESLERWAIVQALKETNGRKLQAAALLCIDYKRFQRKLVRYGLL